MTHNVDTSPLNVSDMRHGALLLALLIILATVVLARCRRAPDLCAHSEYDRYVLWHPDECDPYTDELQAFAERARWN